MGEGLLGSASERQKPQRQRVSHWLILVLRFSLLNWSLAIWERRILSQGGSIFLGVREQRSKGAGELGSKGARGKVLPEVTWADGGLAGNGIVF